MGEAREASPVRAGNAWPLCGRDEELRHARDMLHMSRALVVAGAAGVGKSRLAAAIADAAGDPAAPARRVVATAASTSVPLGAFGSLLWDQNDGDASPDLTWSLVRAATRLRGKFLTVDDAHLLDAASATLVQQLASDGTTRLIVTIRSGEPVPDAITSLWKDLGAARIDLDTLSADETTHLLETVLGGPVVPGTTAAIYDQTHGNPLHIREMLHAGLDQERLVQTRGVWQWDGALASGPRLGELVGERIRTLGADELSGLRSLAFAEQLPFSSAALLIGSARLTTLERAGLIVIDPVTRTVEVAHPVYREIVRSETPPAESMVLHDGLVGIGDASIEPITRVLWWLRSTRSVAIDRALVLDAATQAWRQMTPDLALTMLEAVPAAERNDDRFRLLRASSFVDLHRPTEAVDDFAAVFREAPHEPDRARGASGLIWSLLEGREDPDAAAAVLAEAEERITDQPTLDLVRARYVGSLVQRGGRADPDLVQRLSAHTDARVRLYAYQAASVMWIEAGDDGVDAAFALLDAATAAADEIPRALEWVFTGLVTNLLVQGDLDAVAALLAAGRANVAGAGPDAIAALDVLEARVQLLRGEAAGALANATRALAVMDHVMPLDTYVTWALSIQAAAAGLLGDDALARQACAEADTHDGRIVAFVAIDSRRERIKSRSRIDRTGTSRELIALAARCREDGYRVSEFFSLYDATSLVPHTEVDRRVLELAAGMSGRWAEIATRRLHARRARDPSELEAAAVTYEHMGARFLALETLAEAERLHRAHGQRPRVDRTRARAQRIAGECQGAQLSQFPATVEPQALTRREQEIAALAARGLTSSEIGERLFISRRTVDNQLSRIYAKLGVSGRDELSNLMR